MYYREHPISPSQQAIDGPLCIYVEGGKKDGGGAQQLFALSVLRHATEEQIQKAMPFVQQSQGVSSAAIQEMLGR